MKQRRYEVLICQGCQNKNVIRNDRAKILNRETFFCNSCTHKRQAEKAFRESLGVAAEFIKDTAIRDGRKRYVLVDCAQCSQEYWARFDNWESGYQKCWTCAHPNQQQHGKTGSVLHNRWLGIIRRTEISKQPSHIRIYQDRGIAMCAEWRHDFLAFEKWALENGYKSGLVLDRTDNYQGYSPDNCRWVTMKESTANRRKFTYV